MKIIDWFKKKKCFPVFLSALLLIVAIPIGITLGKYVLNRDAGSFNLTVNLGPRNYTLIEGKELVKAIKNDYSNSGWVMPNTTVTELIIGDYATYSARVGAVADTAVNVDTENKGTIKLYRVPNESNPETYTVYILSEGSIYANENCSHAFFALESLESLRMENFDTSKVTNMSTMFCQLYSMEELDISNLNTSNVTNMNSAFSYNKKLTTLDLSSLDTSNVTNMSTMVAHCDNLETLDLRGFDTSNVTNMWAMFTDCTNLKTIYVDSDWNTNKVESNYWIFHNCNSLVGGNGTAWDSSHADELSYARIDGGESNPGYFTFKLTSGSYMLINGEELIAAIKNDTMWANTNTTITELIIGDYATYSSRVDAVAETAVNVDTEDKGTIKLYRVPNESNPETYTVYILSEGNIYANPDCSQSFVALKGLESLRMENFDTSRVTNMTQMFNGCTNLKALDLSGFNTSNVTSMECLFQNCTNLETLDLSGFDTSNVTSMRSMFWECNNLKTIYVDSDWNTTKVNSNDYIFRNCNSLVGGNGTAWDSSHEGDLSYARIDGGESAPGYFTEKVISE